MTRKDFMTELRDRLSRLSEDERNAALSYYEEYFDEAGPEREQDVIRELGSPASLASRILAEHAVKEARLQPYNPKKGFSAVWSVFVAILAAPFAIPVVIVLFALMVAALSVIVSIGVVGISLILAGVGAFIGGCFALMSTPATAIVGFGLAFVLWGLSKIVFVIVGAVASLFGALMAGIFGRSKGANRG